MPATTLRLEPHDEFCHPIESARNFNESMYLNLLDGEQRLGAWLRVGNRPNEGYAEVSVCVYLPDGRVGFLFARPQIDGNDRLDAAGCSFTVEVPFERLCVDYSGPLCVLSEPRELADPKAALTTNPIVDAEIHLVVEGLAPPVGGEPVDEPDHPTAEFARAHYEQHLRGHGEIRVGDETFRLDGLGLRDHSWGPRYWQNIRWYRWFPLVFGPDFAACPALVADQAGGLHPGGFVLRAGAEGTAYSPITAVDIASDYDDEGYAVAQRLTLTAPDRSYEITGRALSLVPLRNRRTGDDGAEFVTRITEAFTRFECEGRVGFGMSEYLDLVVDGTPAGRPR